MSTTSSFRSLRAEAVRDHLVESYGIDPARLEVTGYGEEQLRVPENPEAAANRRVQIFNIGEDTSE